MRIDPHPSYPHPPYESTSRGVAGVALIAERDGDVHRFDVRLPGAEETVFRAY